MKNAGEKDQRLPTWNPFEDWKHIDVPWIRVKISPEDLRRFTRRSNFWGLLQTLGFLALVTATGALAYYAFLNRRWGWMAAALYVHGTFYSFFGPALHELGHNTVFASRWLNVCFTTFFGLLNWAKNPHLYRLSHQGYHHRYTLYENSDGEDVPNYVNLRPRLIFDLFFRVLRIKALIHNLGRLFTLKPTSAGWRGRGYRLDNWERFILERASDEQRRQVRRHAIASLVFVLAFSAAAIAAGHWFLIVLVPLAPFYGAGVLGFLTGLQQHAACLANTPDFRLSCGSMRLDPLTSFLYWRMEYHTEHHMFAAIPCYNLKAFRRFVDDQMPPLEPAVPRLFRVARRCKEMWGSPARWREIHGRFKGL